MPDPELNSNLYRYCHNDPVNKSDPTGLIIDYEYSDPNEAAATRATVARLERMGGEIADTVKQLRDSDNRIVFIPIQRNIAGLDKYNLPPREKGHENINRTTPNNEERSRNGQGTGSKIEFDPKNWTDPAGRRRDPAEGAGHEIRHAAANDKGNRLPNAAEEKRAEDFQRKVHEKIKQGY